MKGQALKGHLDGMMLATLEDGPRHGYAVMEALRAGSGGQFDLPTGTVYPALRRLERAGPGPHHVDGGRRPALARVRAHPGGPPLARGGAARLGRVLQRRHRPARAPAATTAGDAVTGRAPLADPADPAIEAYLAAIAARLPGPARPAGTSSAS